MENDPRSSDFGKTDEVLRAGDIVLDIKNVLLWIAGERVSLRLREFELLAVLISQPGQLVTRKELAAKLWGNDSAHSSRTIDAHVFRVRAALARSTSRNYIDTVRGIGYRMVVSDHEAGPPPARTAGAEVSRQKS